MSCGSAWRLNQGDAEAFEKAWGAGSNADVGKDAGRVRLGQHKSDEPATGAMTPPEAQTNRKRPRQPQRPKWHRDSKGKINHGASPFDAPT
jgi:hypothetical protein